MMTFIKDPEGNFINLEYVRKVCFENSDSVSLYYQDGDSMTFVLKKDDVVTRLRFNDFISKLKKLIGEG